MLTKENIIKRFEHHIWYRPHNHARHPELPIYSSVRVPHVRPTRSFSYGLLWVSMYIVCASRPHGRKHLLAMKTENFGTSACFFSCDFHVQKLYLYRVILYLSISFAFHHNIQENGSSHVQSGRKMTMKSLHSASLAISLFFSSLPAIRLGILTNASSRAQNGL